MCFLLEGLMVFRLTTLLSRQEKSVQKGGETKTNTDQVLSTVTLMTRSSHVPHPNLMTGYYIIPIPEMKTLKPRQVEKRGQDLAVLLSLAGTDPTECTACA